MLFKSKKKANELNKSSKIDPSILEAKKVKSAILIDFILSIEIIIITLGTVLEEPISIQNLCSFYYCFTIDNWSL